ncbi:MAG: T9SS type A sorting domain-containing protein [Lewinellaceae bacterium]|nr:T9SS type A sorting domain-containing protein [Lewinellaceae bacterium]
MEGLLVAAGHLFMEYPGISGKDINGWIVKVSEQGDSLWSRYLRFFTQSPDWTLMHFLYDIKETADGGFVMAGQAEDFEAGWQGQQGWLVKVDEHGCLVPGCHLVGTASESAAAGPRLLLFPNPAGDLLNVFLKDPALPLRSGAAFRILDAEGRLLATYSAGRLEEATHILPVQGLPAGLYLLQYSEEQGVLWSGKFVKQ